MQACCNVIAAELESASCNTNASKLVFTKGPTKALPQARLDGLEQLFPRHAQRALDVHAAGVTVEPCRRGCGRQIRYL